MYIKAINARKHARAIWLELALGKLATGTWFGFGCCGHAPKPNGLNRNDGNTGCRFRRSIFWYDSICYFYLHINLFIWQHLIWGNVYTQLD